MAIERWEYKIVEVKTRGASADDHRLDAQTQLNALGAQGWELVYKNEDSGWGGVFYFKRRLP